jgi:hypothetical protein
MTRSALGFMLVLVALIVPRAAHAERPSRPASEAEADSSAAAALLQVLSPRYSTSYEVSRQTTAWGQSFDFGAGFGFMNFNNQASFDVKRDTDRAEERRDGSNSTDLRWFFIPGVPLHMNLKAGRQSKTGPNTESQVDNLGTSLSANYRRNLLGITHTFDGGGGFDQTKTVSVSNDLSSRITDSGVNGDLGYRFRWVSRGEVFLADGAYRERLSDRTSELRSSTVDTVQTQPSSSRDRATSANFSFTPDDRLDGKLSVSDSARRNRLYVAQSGVGSLDDQENTKTAVDAEIHLNPRPTLEWGLRAGASKSAFLSKAREDLASASTGRSWESTFKATVWGTALDARISSRRDRIEPAVSDTTESESTSLEGKLNRRLGAKLIAKFDWLVRADQLFYQNVDPTERSDRDELKTKLQPAVTYSPTPTWTITTTYIRSVSRRVEVNPKRATQTRREEDYTVDFNISHRFSAATAMTQTYSIKALTTLYDYVPDADRLLATQRISTSLTSTVTERVTLNLDHRFTLQDSGPYVQEADGSRGFARSLRKYRQELASTVEYKVTPWLTLDTNSRFLRTDDLNEASGARTTTRNLELKHGFNVVRNLASGLNFQARGSYVNSNTRDAYWTLSSNLSKDF